MNHEKMNVSWKSWEKLIVNNFFHNKMTMGARNDHDLLVLDSGLHLVCRCIARK